MKISLYTTWKQQCGIADYSCQLTAALEKQGDSVQIVPVDRKGLVDLALLAKKMNKADIAHVQHEFSFFTHAFFVRSFVHAIVFLRRIRIPKVLTMHEVVPWGRQLRSFPFPSLYRMLFASADIITVHTEQHRRMVLDRGADEKKVLLMPIPVPEPAPLPQTKEHYKRLLGLEGKQVLTLFGFPNSRKGYELTLDAMKDMDNDVFFLIAGGQHPNDRTGYVDRLMHMVREMRLEQRTKMLGYIPESQLPEVMGATDIILAPFHDMPGSASLSLGVAYHKPIIGSDIEQMLELKTRGIGVEIFQRAKKDDLREKIASVLADPGKQAELERRSRIYAEGYSYTRTAARLRELYSSMLRGDKPSRAFLSDVPER